MNKFRAPSPADELPNHRGTQPEHLCALCRLPLLRSGLPTDSPAVARSAKAGAPRLI